MEHEETMNELFIFFDKTCVRKFLTRRINISYKFASLFACLTKLRFMFKEMQMKRKRIADKKYNMTDFYSLERYKIV